MQKNDEALSNISNRPPSLEEIDRALDAKLCKNLSSAAKMKILRVILPAGKPLTVTEIVKQSGYSQGQTSQLLGALLEAEIVTSERDGKFVRYSEHPDVRSRIEKLMSVLGRTSIS